MIQGQYHRIGKVISAVAVVLFFGIGYFTILGARSEKTESLTTVSGAAFTVDGTVDSDEVDVSSKLPGRLARMLVDEGDFVRAGQVVAVLESEEIDAKRDQAAAGVQASEAQLGQGIIAVELESRKSDSQVKQAEAGLEAARASLGMAQQKLAALESGARPQEIAQAQQAVAAAQAQFNAAKKTYDRVASLNDEGVVSLQKRDEVEMTYRSAEAQLNAAQARLDLVREGARREEIEAAREQARQARAGVSAAEQTLQLAKDARMMVDIRRKDVAAAGQKVAASEGLLREVSAYKKQTEIVSPLTGRVTQRLSRAGEIVAPGYAILSIARTDRYWVDVYVDESKFAGRGVGDRVSVEFPALGKSVPARISRTLAAADFATKRSTNERASFDMRSVQLRVRLEEIPKNLATGMTARVLFAGVNGGSK